MVYSPNVFRRQITGNSRHFAQCHRECFSGAEAPTTRGYNTAGETRSSQGKKTGLYKVALNYSLK